MRWLLAVVLTSGVMMIMGGLAGPANAANARATSSTPVDDVVGLVTLTVGRALQAGCLVSLVSQVVDHNPPNGDCL